MAVVVAHPVEFDLLEVSGAVVLVWLTAAQPIQHISNVVLSFSAPEWGEIMAYHQTWLDCR